MLLALAALALIEDAKSLRSSISSSGERRRPYAKSYASSARIAPSPGVGAGALSVAWALGGAAAASPSPSSPPSPGGPSRSYLLLLFRAAVASSASWLAWLALGEARAGAAAEAEERERERRRRLPSPPRRSVAAVEEASSASAATTTATIASSSPSRSIKAGTIEAGRDLPLLPSPSLRAFAAAALVIAAAARAAAAASSSLSSSSTFIAFAFVALSASLSVSLTHFVLKRAPESFTLGEASAVACCAALALADAAAVSMSSSSSFSSSSASFAASLEALFGASTRSLESRFVQRVGLGSAAGATLAVPLLRAAFLSTSTAATIATRRRNERNKSVALALLVAGAAAAARPFFRDATWAVLYALGLEGGIIGGEGFLKWRQQLGGGSGGGGSSRFDDRMIRRQRIVSAWALALFVALPLLHFVSAPSPTEADAEAEAEATEPKSSVLSPRSNTRKRATRAASRRRRKKWRRPPTILLRKAYHVLALAMFAPVALSRRSSALGDPGLLCVGLAAAAAALFAAEAARASSLPLLGIGPAVARFMGRFVDARDEGALLVSHFSLLLGMAGPLWLLSLSKSESKSDSAAGVALSLAGVVSLGTVDAAASAVGRAVGKRKLLGTQKTLEGTLAGAAAGALAWGVLWPRLLSSEARMQPLFRRRWLLPTSLANGNANPSLPAAVLASALSALMEAATTQLDNVFLPLHHLAALGALARLSS